jgi:hypothetical protein
VRPIDHTDPAERNARIERMIEEFRAAKQRQLLQQAIKLWRETEAQQQLERFDAPPERIH